nr:hypothetical protein [Streptomyces sp. 8P21H-1]
MFGYFSAWTADGTIEKLGLHLHRMVREQAGRTAESTACVIDAQSAKTATSVPTDTQGTDVGRKIVGRKRGIVVDTLGLLLLVMVTAAGVPDNGVYVSSGAFAVSGSLPQRVTSAMVYGVIHTSPVSP